MKNNRMDQPRSDHGVISMRQGEELNVKRLESFIRENVEGLDDSPLEIKQFGMGASNLTYLLQTKKWEAVLRRPPLGPVAPKAHDMAREYKILSMIHPVFPLAPKPYVFSDDQEIIGSPFFIMERRHGIVLDTEFPEHVKPSPELCLRISEEMVDRLVQLHSIDIKETGLESIGRSEGFMERQVLGWIDRYERAKTEDVEGVEELKSWLVSNLPPSPPASLIHYDYKLNNVMFATNDITKMVGVFDWEMTTVGDPLVDLACAMSYWIQADDPEELKRGFGRLPVTVTEGFLSRSEFIRSYARKSGRDLSRMDFYLAFANFKLAVICQQIYYRWKKGQTKDVRFSTFGDFVRTLIFTSREISHGSFS